jgi:hypothetical protein
MFVDQNVTRSEHLDWTVPRTKWGGGGRVLKVSFCLHENMLYTSTSNFYAFASLLKEATNERMVRSSKCSFILWYIVPCLCFTLKNLYFSIFLFFYFSPV